MAKKVLLIIFVVFLGLILFETLLVTSTPFKKDATLQVKAPSEDVLNVCEQDSDCIYIRYNHCCVSFRSINRKYVDDYNAHPEWQGVDRETCIDIPCEPTALFEEIDTESSTCIRDYNGIKGNNRCI